MHLGRGGSEGCSLPQNVERLNGLGVVQVACGAQFSLALTSNGEVIYWIYHYLKSFNCDF